MRRLQECKVTDVDYELGVSPLVAAVTGDKTEGNVTSTCALMMASGTPLMYADVDLMKPEASC